MSITLLYLKRNDIQHNYSLSKPSQYCNHSIILSITTNVVFSYTLVYVAQLQAINDNENLFCTFFREGSKMNLVF